MVSTPCTGQALAEFEHQGQNAEQHEDNDDEGDDSNNDNEHASSFVTSEAAAASPFTTVNVRRKGKNGKGTVVSGGIKKNKGNAPTASSANTGGSEFGSGKEEDKDSNDWRPSPEVCKKIKRQLRNKISARNFRVRRKSLFS